MNHILSDDGMIDFDRYLAYLETVREKLPDHVFSFASDSRHFDLESRTSLHDAWLESAVVKEMPSSNEGNRKVDIVLTLLGPFHDRLIQLRYSDVERYSLAALTSQQDLGNRPSGHGDLYTHEIRLGEKGQLVHELLFVNDATIFIEFSGFSHSNLPVDRVP